MLEKGPASRHTTINGAKERKKIMSPFYSSRLKYCIGTHVTKPTFYYCLRLDTRTILPTKKWGWLGKGAEKIDGRPINLDVKYRLFVLRSLLLKYQ
jgi:hypothetical protein